MPEDVVKWIVNPPLVFKANEVLGPDLSIEIDGNIDHLCALCVSDPDELLVTLFRVLRPLAKADHFPLADCQRFPDQGLFFMNQVYGYY